MHILCPEQRRVILLVVDNFRNASQLYFLETSGKSYLDPRSACAIESAAVNTNLEVVVVLTSSLLSLESLATCKLFRHYPNIQFATLGVFQMMQGKL